MNNEKKGYKFTELNPIEDVVEKTETPEAQELITGKEAKNNKVSKLVSSKKEAMEAFNLTEAEEPISAFISRGDKEDLELILIKRRNLNQKELIKEYVLKAIKDDMKRLGLKSLREE